MPHASLLVAAGEIAGLGAGIWMGGAHSHVGQPVEVAHAASGVIVDCAGDVPAAYREAGGQWIACVFTDLDAPPPNLATIERHARTLGAALARRNGSSAAPENVYILCTHGMNRSGLVAGLLLRELGMAGPKAIERIVERRPGALSNVAFRTIVAGG